MTNFGYQAQFQVSNSNNLLNQQAVCSWQLAGNNLTINNSITDFGYQAQVQVSSSRLQ